MKAENFSRCWASAGRRGAVVLFFAAALAALPACYHREANIIVAPIPIQIDSSRVEGRGVPVVGPRWHRLEPGMTKEDVVEFVGEPTRREYEGNFSSGNLETWYFDSYDVHDGHFNPHLVTFDHGRVVYVAFDRARLEEKAAEKTAAARQAMLDEIVPDDVGVACESNEVCTSKNCVAGRCAGPHGCTRSVGDACLSDLDCCSHHCNMGARVCNGS